jgi:hypothetical protein
MEYSTYGAHSKVLTSEEEQKFYDYVTNLASMGFGIDRKRVDFKLKMILSARGAVWDTLGGKYASSLASHFSSFLI